MLGFSTSETSFFPCSNSNVVGPSQRWNRQGPNGDLTGWSSLVPGNRRQHLGWGLQALWPLLMGWWWGNRAVLQESCVQSEVTIFHLGGGSKTLLCIFLWVGTRTLSGGCTNLWLFLFLYPLPSLISNCLNPRFGIQGRPRRLNKVYILQIRNGEQSRSVLQSPTESRSVLILGN